MNCHGNLRGQEWRQSWEKKDDLLKQRSSMSKPQTRTVSGAPDAQKSDLGQGMKHAREGGMSQTTGTL